MADVIFLLSGKARLWATVEWERKSAICSLYDALCLKLQGSRLVAKFVVAEWVKPQGAYIALWLFVEVKDQFSTRELPPRLDNLITQATRIDRWI